jgi:peptidoglycan/LPS O-acetylase OafA/YrhL
MQTNQTTRVDRRIPSLDGLRAISIGCVLISHLIDMGSVPGRAFLHRFFGDLGNLGVRIFFVISGYLITRLMFEELQKNGAVSLQAFYVRRGFRILPPCYAFLTVLIAASLIRFRDLIPALTYTANYPIRQYSFWIQHLWSLSVEEQFYLLWPAAFVLLGTAIATRVSWLCVIAVPAIRVVLYSFGPHWYAVCINHTFETTCDAIATGCLLALIDRRLLEQRWYLRLLLSRAAYCFPIGIVVLSTLCRHPRFAYAIGFSLLNILIALCIHHSILRPQTISGRLLNWPPIAYVGVLSYSLYLWQQLFIVRYSRFPWNVCCAVAAAMLSYYVVEQPALKLRNWVLRYALGSHREPITVAGD